MSQKECIPHGRTCCGTSPERLGLPEGVDTQERGSTCRTGKHKDTVFPLPTPEKGAAGSGKEVEKE